jgi:hypothetical protein
MTTLVAQCYPPFGRSVLVCRRWVGGVKVTGQVVALFGSWQPPVYLPLVR